MGCAASCCKGNSAVADPHPSSREASRDQAPPPEPPPRPVVPREEERAAAVPLQSDPSVAKIEVEEPPAADGAPAQ
eukprot:CAMPEP_0114138286 /NCGR_PEP_ID=MMETSP0043_2-20121206/16237_1 /TAXON_ID=464988 /ORGANISM="Hemiselmis andersenii, Strain CCMP644" /LENGTH=75 /DNA_ID=CAMNT_0001232237 /DNA_START=173 /DNA_END=397 /DNA_ORIENTATION=+